MYSVEHMGRSCEIKVVNYQGPNRQTHTSARFDGHFFLRKKLYKSKASGKNQQLTLVLLIIGSLLGWRPKRSRNLVYNK